MKPSPNIGFGRDSPDPVAMDALSGSDIWIVGHAHDAHDNTTPAYLALHRNGFSSQVTLAPHPPGYVYGAEDLYLMDVEMVSSNDVWAVGTGGRQGNTIIQHWNGFHWSIVPSPRVGQEISSFDGLAAVNRNDIWAVGQTYSRTDQAKHSLVAHWDGSSWSLVQTPDAGALHAVTAISSTDVWAVGDGKSLHWDGAVWTMVPAPEGRWESVAASGPRDVWLAGWTRRALKDSPAIARWDGTSWRSIPVDDVPRIGSEEEGQLHAITAVAKDDVWAVGVNIGEERRNPAGFGLPPFGRTLVMHWDGNTWSYVPSPNPTQSQHLSDVVALGPDEIWVVGELNDLSSDSKVLLARFARTPCTS
ncbi:MAG: hypothetical protein M3437_13100 [Chloroflexota bacterium]|nr:hypothetical protein [Chloroflexota bacterium]MDQ5864380.1 hypothetical protein [Chloroflexota bacterium]